MPKMPVAWHEQTEWESAAAYEAGIRRGIEIANTVYADLIAAALERPAGYGGPDLEESARAVWADMFRRYLGMPAPLPVVDPVAADWRYRRGIR
jgi:hypothetical protein